MVVFLAQIWELAFRGRSFDTELGGWSRDFLGFAPLSEGFFPPPLKSTFFH